MAGLSGEHGKARVGTTRDASGTPVISIAGELDIANVNAIEAEFQSVLASSSRVRFDLSALTFMDSSGIAMLLRAADRFDIVELARPSPTIQRVIRATGLTEVFEVVDG